MKNKTPKAPRNGKQASLGTVANEVIDDAENARRAGGRPTDYKPEYVEQVEKLCLLGATDDEIADFFKVHRSTIYRWKLEYPEFCDAVKTAKVIADERVERSLYQKATGYNYKDEQAVKLKVGQYEEKVEVVSVEKHAPADTTAAIFWLKNRRKDAWRDRHEHEIGRPGDFEQMSDDELAKFIERETTALSSGSTGTQEAGNQAGGGSRSGRVH